MLPGAFRFVVGRTTIPMDVVARLEPAFIAANRSGDRRAERQCVAEHLSSIEWRWPWFEGWAERFHDLGIEPYVWRSFREAIDRRDGGDADIRPFLVGHTIASRANTKKGLATASQISDRRWPRFMVGDGCRAEALVAKEAWPAVAQGDLRILPPLFPGDRTLLQWLTKWELERRPGLYTAWEPRPAEPVSQASVLAALMADELG
ncbi:hypothetical protein [Elioraea sp.]|uniref:hypothetical protein n=1 Tax=Elioraea sp. TaxID=2185103 RepID=UPI003F6EA34D